MDFIASTSSDSFCSAAAAALCAVQPAFTASKVSHAFKQKRDGHNTQALESVLFFPNAVPYLFEVVLSTPEWAFGCF